jgi:acetylornithine/succinyldiaminopimelate/putrescine aminotransferase
VQSNLLNAHAIYTQVARSNPLVLRVQPPLIVSAAQVDRFLDALRSTCAEWALLSECAETILSKSAGEMGPR